MSTETKNTGFIDFAVKQAIKILTPMVRNNVPSIQKTLQEMIDKVEFEGTENQAAIMFFNENETIQAGIVAMDENNTITRVVESTPLDSLLINLLNRI